MKSDDSIPKLILPKLNFVENSDGLSTGVTNILKLNKSDEALKKLPLEKNVNTDTAPEEEMNNQSSVSSPSNAFTSLPPTPFVRIQSGDLPSTSDCCNSFNGAINANSDLYDSSNKPVVEAESSSNGRETETPHEAKWLGNRCGKCCNFLFWWKTDFLEKIGDCFGRYVEWVNRFPWIFIIVSTIICLGLGTGFFFRDIVTSGGEQYALQHSEAKKVEKEFTAVFGGLSRNEFIIVHSKNRTNLLTAPFLNKLWELHEGILNITVKHELDITKERNSRRVNSLLHNSDKLINKPRNLGRVFGQDKDISQIGELNNGATNINPRDKISGLKNKKMLSENVWAYQNLCIKDYKGVCYSPNGVLFLYDDRKLFGSPISYPVQTLFNTYEKFTTDMWISPKTMMLDESGKHVIAASSFLIMYTITGKSNMSSAAEAWEKQLVAYVLQHSSDLPNAHVYIKAEYSLKHELAASTTFKSLRDYFLVCGTILLLFVYIILVSFSRDFRKAKLLSSVMGGVAAGLGYIGGCGFCYLIGIQQTNTAAATPFLVLGIGVDDMFVILNSYTLTYMSTDTSKRLHVALKDCGLSITITTLTNLIAFAIGASSPYLAIRNFCILTAAGLFAGYIMALTFFLGWLCIDAKREERKAKYYCLALRSVSVNLSDVDNFNKKNVLSRQELSVYVSSTFRLVALQTSAYDAGFTESWVKRNFTLTNNFINKECKPSIQEILQHVTTETFLRSLTAAFNDSLNIYSTDADNDIYYAFLTLLKRFEFSNSCSKHRSCTCSSKSGKHILCNNCKQLGAIETISGDSFEKCEIDENEASGDLAEKNSLCEILGSRLIGPKNIICILITYLTEPKGNVGRRWRLFFLKAYGWFIMKPLVKFLVLLIFIAYMIISSWGSTMLQLGLDVRKLAEDNSYLANFFDVQELTFVKYGDPVQIFFSDNANWCDKNFLAMYVNHHDFLASASYTLVLKDGLMEFMKSPLGEDLAGKNQDHCNKMLAEWLMTPIGSNFYYDFVWNNDKTLKAWKITLIPHYLNNSKDQGIFMDQIRSDLKKLNIGSVPYSRMFVYYESDRDIVWNTLSNMGYAALSVLLVSLLLLSSLWCGVLVVIIIVMIDTGIIGFMVLWGLPLNMLTMVNLVISIGFSVDYSTHICHTFCHCVGRTRNLRSIETLALMGNPILHGAISTQLAVILLAFSTSYILRVFFKMMTLVLLLGALHGLVLLPVVLSLIGPAKGIERKGSLWHNFENSFISVAKNIISIMYNFFKSIKIIITKHANTRRM